MNANLKSVFLFALLNTGVICLISEGKLIDLTHPFDETTIGFPGFKPFELNFTHFGWTKDGYWLQTEDICSATHFGTHMDAPCHTVPGQWTLEDVPLYRFMAPAVVVDISSRTSVNRDANLEIADLVAWEIRNRISLDGTIVLVNTGWSKKWRNKKEFLGTDDVNKLHFPGVSPAAAEWLAQYRSIYAVGIDTVGLDNPHVCTTKSSRSPLQGQHLRIGKCSSNSQVARIRSETFRVSHED